jgi:hypothetical protein
VAANDDFVLTPPVPVAGPGAGTRQERARHAERRRQALMVARCGPGPAATCEACFFLKRTGYSKVYLKCARYGDSRSEATDWRAKWPACGGYRARWSVRSTHDLT